MVVIVFAILMFVSPVRAEELVFSIMLKEFSNIDVVSRIAQYKGNQADLASMINELNGGKLLFSQSLNVTDNRTIDEIIVVSDKTVNFRCQFGKVEEGKLTTILTFSMSSKHGEHNIIQQIYYTNTTLQLKLGDKGYIGGISTNNSAHLFLIQVAKPDMK